MGYIKEEINKLIKGKGRAKAGNEVRKWFEKSVKDKKEKAVGSIRSPFIPGKMYVFEYKPVTKDIIWYDDNPVVLALEPYEGDDIGINITMLPPKFREEFLDEIYDKYQPYIKSASKKEDAKRQKGLPMFTYKGAKRYLESFGYDFAIRRYKPFGKSNQAVVAYKDWCKMAICDFDSLQGINKQQLIRLFEDHRRKKNI
tara:strand:+ start:119 stop:715 length:597 start_codon:yes stop_codon:yes gene_type:complete